ncbi:hypothetical protein C8Q80DRAFT_608157 [Daedaleopsis nitida]|nr:hypothetical protein C8Q80DRAFT_608157 [Daedaleopsis nitida]
MVSMVSSSPFSVVELAGGLGDVTLKCDSRRVRRFRTSTNTRHQSLNREVPGGRRLRAPVARLRFASVPVSGVLGPLRPTSSNPRRARRLPQSTHSQYLCDARQDDRYTSAAPGAQRGPERAIARVSAGCRTPVPVALAS